MAKFVVGKHVSEGKFLLTICDSNIHGKRFEEGEVVLDLTAGFYKGTGKGEEETSAEASKAYIINAAGTDSVKLMIKLGLTKPDKVKIIAGIPHVQILKLSES